MVEPQGYSELREVLAYPYRELEASELETVFAQLGADAEDVEGWLANLGRGFQQAVPHLQQAIPGIVSGAVGGTALGPAGILGGALVGGLGAVTQPPGVRPPAARPPGAPVPAAQLSALPGSPAAGQLLQMLSHPAVIQALTSMLLGSAGRRTIPIAGTPVPVAALPSAVAVLAGQAAAEYNEAVYGGAEGESVYLDGVPDPEDPRSRADVVVGLLNTESVELAEWSAAESDGPAWREGINDDMYEDVYYESVY